jgi:hydrophobe/amphiphile efflux-1 (HAE1) family protein
MTLSDVAIKRPVFTLVLTMGLMVMGAMSLRNLGTDLFPAVNFPVVTVTTVYPGAAPGEVEAQVTRPLEDAVAGLEGLDFVKSYSRESVSVVVVLFNLSADIEKAATGVRERVAAVRPQMPAMAKEPSIRRVDVGAAPIRTYVATGNLSHEDFKRITEDVVKPALERVPGVAAVEVVGGRDREVQVELDRLKLDALHLPLTAVVDKLRLDNLALPAGHYAAGAQEVSVRLQGDLRTPDDVGNVVVATTATGTQVRLREVAQIRDDFAEVRTRIRANGQDAVAFEVIKQSGTNTVEVAHAVDRKLAEVAPKFPSGYGTRLIIDQAIFITENAHEVEVSIVYGGIMAVLVILFFMLDLRSTFISALALPTSVVGTFWAMDLLGFSLNIMTLLALSLAIGLLIDDAVVVRENIFRHLERGDDPVTAASKGTSEIALAVLATTLTIVAVFLPVAFMSGVVGQFFKQFGLTISAAVLISLFVAFTLDPMLSARLAVKLEHGHRGNAFVRAMDRFHDSYEEAYASLLRATLRHRWLTVALAFGAFAGSLGLAKLMGQDFVTQEDRGQFMAEIELPPGTSLDETARRTLAAEKQVVADPHVTTVFAKIGPNSEVNKVMWRVLAIPKTERPRSLVQIQDHVREVVKETLPDARLTITPPAFVEGLPAGAPLQVQVRGSNLETLERDAAAVEAMMKSIPGLGDVYMYWSPGKPEQTVRIDRQKAADLGVPVAQVARTLRMALDGEEAGHLRLAEGARKEVQIRVRLGEHDRASVERLLDLQIATPKGFVPLRAMAVVEPQAGPQVIERQERTRQIVVAGVPTTRSLGEVLDDLTPKLDAHPFGGDGHYVLEGQVKQMREMGEAMGMAFALAVVFTFLILAAQFESFLHPFTIMVSLPLALIGALVGLFMTGNSMSMGSNIGIILLAGLVTKNGILLVDAILQNQRDGMSSADAVIDAGKRRLRPILMTSAAMVLGMLPTAVIVGPGSEFRSPMAITVIGGVITSTILTLLVVPSVFLWVERFGGLFRRKAKAADVHGEATKVAVAVGMVLTALAVPVRADEKPAPLTLTEATQRALQANADLRVAIARIDEAKAARSKVNSAWRPDVKAVGTYTHNSDEASFDFAGMAKGLASAFGLPMTPEQLSKLPTPTVIQKHDTVSAVLNVDQTLFAMQPILAGRAADLGLQAQEQGLEAARREIAFRMAEAFHQMAGLERLIRAAERARDLALDRWKQADIRRSKGAEGELPGLRAEAEKQKAEQDLARAAMGREQLLEVVGMLMGEPAPAALAEPPPVEPAAGAVGDLVARAIRQRPDLRAREGAVAAARAMQREAELRWLPLLAGNGYVRWSDTKGFTGQNWLWAVSANLVVPLYDRGMRYAELTERKAAVARAEAELGAAQRQLEWQVKQALHEAQLQERVLAVAKAQADVARKAKMIVDKSQVAGAVTNLEVAEADAQLRMAEAAEERERALGEVSRLRVRHLVGEVK